MDVRICEVEPAGAHVAESEQGGPGEGSGLLMFLGEMSYFIVCVKLSDERLGACN